MIGKIFSLCAPICLTAIVAVTGQASAFEFSLRLQNETNGFHIPQRYRGKTIIVRSPSNEHTVYSIEDMLAAIGAENDILVGETSDISNAYAVIDGKGSSARRMIVFDDGWFDRVSNQGAQYRVILAHEIGHHICKHSLGEFFDQPWEKELQADRAAGAILRKAQNKGIGGGTVGREDIVATIRATMSGQGSKTHPPGNMRLNAYLEGWNNGSPCLTAYVPINPIPRREWTAIERITNRYGDEMRWSFNFRGHSYLRTEIDGNNLRIVFETPSNEYRQAGATPGSLLFEGSSSDTKTIRGTFLHYSAGCEPIRYNAEGSFVENNAIFLAGPPPKVSGCQIVGQYNTTLHVIKNTSDWGFQPPR